jgi:hypothetical protein
MSLDVPMRVHLTLCYPSLLLMMLQANVSLVWMDKGKGRDIQQKFFALDGS